MKKSDKKLKEIFSYEPSTGQFVRLKRRGHQASGLLRNVPAFNGYIYVSVDEKKYLLHRLAWFLFYGEWPKSEIDHIDGDKINNSIANLRLASRAQNEANKKASRANTSGVKGVRWEESRGKWYAYITIDYKMKNLGCFERREDAIAARSLAAKKQHGNFFRAS